MNLNYVIGSLDCSKLEVKEITKYRDLELELKKDVKKILEKFIRGEMEDKDLKDVQIMELFFDAQIKYLQPIIEKLIFKMLGPEDLLKVPTGKLIVKFKWIDAVSKSLYEDILGHIVHWILEKYGIEVATSFLNLYREYEKSRECEKSTECKLRTAKQGFDYSGFNTDIILKLESLADIIKIKIFLIGYYEGNEFVRFFEKYPSATEKDFDRFNSKKVEEYKVEISSSIEEVFKEAEQYFNDKELFDKWKSYVSIYSIY